MDGEKSEYWDCGWIHTVNLIIDSIYFIGGQGYYLLGREIL